MILDGESVEVLLSGASNGDCRFELELIDVDTGSEADSSLIAIE